MDSKAEIPLSELKVYSLDSKCSSLVIENIVAKENEFSYGTSLLIDSSTGSGFVIIKREKKPSSLAFRSGIKYLAKKMQFERRKFKMN
jgi:hypothetical protein